MDRRPRQDGHLVDQQRAPRRAWINPRFAHEQSPPRRGGDQGDRRGGRVDTDGCAALRLLTPHRPRSTALACRCLTVYAMRTRVVIPARFLPVFPDVDTAFASARQPPTRRVTRLRLAAVPYSAATARRLVVATCEFWDCTDVAEDATAIASELVANAFRHAATDAELRLELRRDLLTVALTDGSAAPPARRPADEGEAGGFGLRIVESLSTTWGWAPTSDGGKIVWAVLRIHRERSNGHVRSDR